MSLRIIRTLSHFDVCRSQVLFGRSYFSHLYNCRLFCEIVNICVTLSVTSAQTHWVFRVEFANFKILLNTVLAGDYLLSGIKTRPSRDDISPGAVF